MFRALDATDNGVEELIALSAVLNWQSYLACWKAFKDADEDVITTLGNLETAPP